MLDVHDETNLEDLEGQCFQVRPESSIIKGVVCSPGMSSTRWSMDGKSCRIWEEDEWRSPMSFTPECLTFLCVGLSQASCLKLLVMDMLLTSPAASSLWSKARNFLANKIDISWDYAVFISFCMSQAVLCMEVKRKANMESREQYTVMRLLSEGRECKWGEAGNMGKI